MIIPECLVPDDDADDLTVETAELREVVAEAGRGKVNPKGCERYRHDVVVFSRYENFDTQNRMASGYLPLGEFDRDALVTGITYFPEPDVALKFDYTILRNQSGFIKARNGLNLGIGWWF